MIDLAPSRVFIASPSDAKAEREQIKTAIARYNESQRRPNEREYVLVGWERTRGTARRPQDEINDLIEPCNFMIVVLKSQWGSAPGSPLGYTSGTEEELFTGLLQLGDPDRLMEDVWVVFVDSPSPSPEVTSLRKQMEDKHTLMYDLVTNPLDLERKLNERLGDWQQTVGKKTARHLNLVPETGRDILGAAKLRQEGEMLFRLGQAEPGLKRLEEAVRSGGPIEELAYARLLGRQGQLDDALEHIGIALAAITNLSVELDTTMLGRAVLAEAGVLRRQGKGPDAITRLGAALNELDQRAPGAWRTEAEIRDQRGLVYADAKRFADARVDYLRSLELRNKHDASVLIAQSLVNLVRLESGEKNFAQADRYATEMLDWLGSSTTSVHANAWTAIAQLRLRQGLGADGVWFAQQALALNRQTANTSGEAKSLLVLAQCYRSAGDVDKMSESALRCIELNDDMQNAVGKARAQWLLDHSAPEAPASSAEDR